MKLFIVQNIVYHFSQAFKFCEWDTYIRSQPFSYRPYPARSRSTLRLILGVWVWWIGWCQTGDRSRTTSAAELAAGCVGGKRGCRPTATTPSHQSHLFQVGSLQHYSIISNSFFKLRITVKTQGLRQLFQRCPETSPIKTHLTVTHSGY